jgi:hypothetical protein
MNEQDREILAFAKRALDDPGLNSAVGYDRGGSGGQPRLHAHVLRGQQGERPEPLACADARLQRLIHLGYLSQRGPWLTITPAGEAALTGA